MLVKHYSLNDNADKNIVVEQSGEPLGPIRAALRYICKFLSAIILCLGFLMVAFTKKKVGLHDILTSTRVVYKTKAN